jgi:3-dehydroquinate synthase
MITSRIPVSPPGSLPYDVVVGNDILGELPALLDGSTRVLLLHAAPVAVAAKRAADALRDSRIRVELSQLPDGEAAKDIAVAEAGWAQLGAMHATRDDAVVGFGGGAVTDVAGFIAASWLRGVRVVQVPTTVAGIVDAAIGGKTGINTAAGKNLVGAFHQPAGVLCDLDLLATLPDADFAAGLAEVAKGGFIADPVILELLEADPTGRSDFRELAERKIRVKAEVVSADPKEAGRREILNYGHTLAHALERRENYTWRHGDAVSVGLVFAAELGRRSGRLDDATADWHRALLTRMGLPTTYDLAAWDELHELMRIDKKSRADRLRFVVLDGLAKPGILDDPDPDLLRAAYQALGAEQ